MKISVVPKELFFDRPKMQKLMDRTTFRTLQNFGRYTRTTIRNSLKSKKGPSAPGQPPHSHLGLLRRLVFFFVDPRRRDVSIGPTGFGGSPAVPGLLERGGVVKGDGRLIRVSSGVGRDNRGRFREDAKWVRATGPLRYPPRPFVNPAGERAVREMPRFVAQAKGQAQKRVK
jgi:hypothetical protein